MANEKPPTPAEGVPTALSAEQWIKTLPDEDERTVAELFEAYHAAASKLEAREHLHTVFALEAAGAAAWRSR